MMKEWWLLKKASHREKAAIAHKRTTHIFMLEE
jgi:hypothetical protein